MSTILPSTGTLSTSPTATDRQKLSAVAKQFEAIFMRQMLSAARKTDLQGDDKLFSSQALDTFNQMQDEHFADVTAKSGTLGLASIIEAQMARFLPGTTTTEATDPAAASGSSTTAKGA